MQSTTESYQTPEVIAQVFDNTKDVTIILEYKSNLNSTHYEDDLITGSPMQLKE